MGQKIKLGDKQYDTENLNDQARASLASLQFATTRIEELTNMQALLQRAKKSYLESIRKEVLSNKSGFQFMDD